MTKRHFARRGLQLFPVGNCARAHPLSMSAGSLCLHTKQTAKKSSRREPSTSTIFFCQIAFAWRGALVQWRCSVMAGMACHGAVGAFPLRRHRSSKRLWRPARCCLESQPGKFALAGARGAPHRIIMPGVQLVATIIWSGSYRIGMRSMRASSPNDSRSSSSSMFRMPCSWQNLLAGAPHLWADIAKPAPPPHAGKLSTLASTRDPDN